MTLLKSKIIFIIPFVIIAISGLYGCSGQSLQTREMLISPERELINYALISKGATAESPDNNPEHPPLEVIDGDTSSLDWDSGGGWEGSLSHLRSDEVLKRSYVQINLPGRREVKKIVVYTIDSPKYPADKFGLDSYRLEYWHGTGWEKIETTDDSRDKRFTIQNNRAGKIVHEVADTLETDKIRLVPISSNDTEKSYNLTSFGGRPVYNVSGSARVMEIEVWCYPAVTAVAEAEERNNLLPPGKAKPTPDEQALRDLISEYEQGYDNENLEQVMSVFSEDFKTLDGKTWEDIEDKTARFFANYNKINITFRDTKFTVEPSGEVATAEANYTLECVAEADGNIYRRSDRLIFNFRKTEDSVWKIVSAE